MHDDADKPMDDNELDSDLDRALDRGFAAAGNESEEDDSVTSPSVLGRIAELTGETPKVSLREPAPTGNTPLLKPLGPDDDKLRGKYMVQGELGKGGVGTVHKGHDSDLGRDVAMKFLHDKYASEPAILHRFVEEAQIGGQLQHPGIVPVYDLGMSEGRPFFTMKLVKGETLAKQLNDREAVTDGRRRLLSVFEDVCQTMAYAHARGVVHRDLKPANIMVGAFGEVQVVDWGMGKVLATGGVADEKRAAEKQSTMSVIETVRSQGHGTQSLMGSVMGTPAYMPPEQARGDVEAMDERSDVFALGAILCEILTGSPPYTGAPDELIAMAAMAQLDDCKARLAECGAEQDLVDLATRCLLPAAAARPKSAEAVAESIHEHLAAVEARVHDARVEAAEAKVRAVALTKQRTLGLALTAAVAAGLMVSLWFWFDADAQREIAQQAAIDEAAAAQLAEERRIEAERQRDQVELIAEFMADTLGGASPQVALGRDVTMLREMMVAAADRIESGELAESPLAELQLRLRISWTCRDVSAFSDAERMIEPALALAREVHAADHVDTVQVLTELGLLRLAQGDATAAAKPARDALAMARRLFSGDHEALIAPCCLMAQLAHTQGDYAEAESRWHDCIAMVRRLNLPDDGWLSMLLQDYGTTLTKRGDWATAERVYREALTLCRRSAGGASPPLASCLASLAQIRLALGDVAEAERFGREALAMQQQLFPGDHMGKVHGCLTLAPILLSRRDLAGAERLLREGLEMVRRLVVGDHTLAASCLSHLGSVMQGHGDLAAAESMHRQAVAMYRRLVPGDSTGVATGLINLGGLFARQGRFDAAESHCRESLAMWRRLPGPSHAFMGRGLRLLAELLCRRGEYQAAAPLYRESLAIRRQVYPGDHAEVAGALVDLAGVLEECGDSASAAPLAREAKAMYQRLGLPVLHRFGAWRQWPAPAEADPGARLAHAWALLDSNSPEAGTHDSDRALELAEQIVQETRSVECGPLQLLAEAQFANGRSADARSSMRRAMRAWQAARTAEKDALGERDLQWMQQRLKEYGK